MISKKWRKNRRRNRENTEKYRDIEAKVLGKYRKNNTTFLTDYQNSTQLHNAVTPHTEGRQLPILFLTPHTRGRHLPYMTIFYLSLSRNNNYDSESMTVFQSSCLS